MNKLYLATKIINENRATFIWLCAGFYGILFFAMAITMFFPNLKIIAQTYYDINNLQGIPIIQSVFAAYAAGQILKASALTFLVNFFYVAIILTLVPSVICRYLGIVLVMLRATFWGAMFAPFGFERMIAIPHLPTVLLEGLAYVIAAFGSYLYVSTIQSRIKFGLADDKAVLISATKDMISVYILVAAILGIAALYEGYEVIRLVPLFVGK